MPPKTIPNAAVAQPGKVEGPCFICDHQVTEEDDRAAYAAYNLPPRDPNSTEPPARKESWWKTPDPPNFFKRVYVHARCPTRFPKAKREGKLQFQNGVPVRMGNLREPEAKGRSHDMHPSFAEHRYIYTIPGLGENPHPDDDNWENPDPDDELTEEEQVKMKFGELQTPVNKLPLHPYLTSGSQMKKKTRKYNPPGEVSSAVRKIGESEVSLERLWKKVRSTQDPSKGELFMQFKTQTRSDQEVQIATSEISKSCKLKRERVSLPLT